MYQNFWSGQQSCKHGRTLGLYLLAANPHMSPGVESGVSSGQCVFVNSPAGAASWLAALMMMM